MDTSKKIPEIPVDLWKIIFTNVEMVHIGKVARINKTFKDAMYDVQNVCMYKTYDDLTDDEWRDFNDFIDILIQEKITPVHTINDLFDAYIRRYNEMPWVWSSVLKYGKLELIQDAFDRLTPIQVSLALENSHALYQGCEFRKDLEVIQYIFAKTMLHRLWTRQHGVDYNEKSHLLQMARIYRVKEDVMQYLMTEYPEDVNSFYIDNITNF